VSWEHQRVRIETSQHDMCDIQLIQLPYFFGSGNRLEVMTGKLNMKIASLHVSNQYWMIFAPIWVVVEPTHLSCVIYSF